MEVKTLSSPPIVEALIEIRFNPNKNVTIQKLDNFAQSLSNQYPHIEPVENQSFNIKFDGENGPEHDFQSQPIGFKLQNINNTKIIIAAIDKLTVSSLSPYSPWPSLLELTRELTEKYLAFSPQKEIVRIGLRYINRIDLPLSDDFAFQNYINTFQPLPKHPDLPTGLSRFESATVIPFNDIEAAGTIRQGIREPEKDKEYLPFFLDIDIFKEGTIKIEEIDKVWDVLELMRIKKNGIFFGTLKDEALKPYV